MSKRMTREAWGVLEKVAQNAAVPAFWTTNLVRIAEENGYKVSGLDRPTDFLSYLQSMKPPRRWWFR